MIKFSEEMYKEFVESSQDLMWQCDTEGRYVFLNKAWESVLGYPIEEMLGRPFTDFMSPEQAAHDTETFRKLLEEDSVRDHETCHIGRDGQTRWLSFNASHVTGRDGNIEGTRGIAYDITERKQAEADLEESKRRYNEMVMHSPMGMHFYDLNGDKLVFSDFNPAADRLLAVSNAQFLGKTIEEAFPPLAETEVPARYRAAAAEGTPWFTEQVMYADNQIAGAFEVHAFQIAPNKMVAVFLEITDRKRTEEALKHEKERVSVTLRSIGDGVIATDVSGRITLMNKVAEHMTGWSVNEAFGRALRDVFNIVHETTRQACANPVERALASLKVVELANHTVLIAKDGTERQIADSGAPIFDADGDIIGVVLVFRDVTEKTKINEAIQRSNKLESLGVLAGGIAHDFNNLLGGIFGYIDLAKDMSEDPPVKEYLEKAFFTMERARALTEQLLTFSKGGQPILKLLNPGPIVERAAKFMLSGTGIALRCRFPETLFRCRIDENQFCQVIDNMVINALQAMPVGGQITVSGDNVVLEPGGHPVLSPGNYVRITVLDTGVGIPKEILPNIFDPFFSTKQKGSGLGLATCYSIIQKHGGAIDVDSSPGKGTVFSIYLPAVSCDGLSTDSDGAGKSKEPTGHLLIMDDEDYIREVLGDMLRRIGYIVTAADCGEKAIDALKSESKDSPFTAAILDLTVPGGLGGKDTALRLREIRPNLPVFLSSGYSDDPVIADPSAFGFSGSFIKPYRRQDLESVLKTFFAAADKK